MGYWHRAKRWMEKHPFQTFFLGLDYDLNTGYHKYDEEEQWKLCIKPNSSCSQIASIAMCLFLWALFLGMYQHCAISFIYAFCFLAIMTIGHIIYMFYYLKLPRIRHDDFKHKHILGKISCLLMLFVCLYTINETYREYQTFLLFNKTYNVGNKYSETAVRKVYYEWLSINHAKEHEKIHSDINELKNILNLNDKPETIIP